MEVVKAGVATFAASRAKWPRWKWSSRRRPFAEPQKWAEVEVVRGRRRYVRRLGTQKWPRWKWSRSRRRYVRRLEPEVAEVEVGQRPASLRSPPRAVADMELVDVGFGKGHRRRRDLRNCGIVQPSVPPEIGDEPGFVLEQVEFGIGLVPCRVNQRRRKLQRGAGPGVKFLSGQKRCPSLLYPSCGGG